MMRAKWAVFWAYTIPPLLCIPMYCAFSISPILLDRGFQTSNELMETLYAGNLSNSIETAVSSEENFDTRYIVNLSNMALAYPFLKKANFWFFR